MPTTLDPTRFELPAIEGWPAGDSRQLSFTVEQGGTPKDITNDTVEWYLLKRPYHDLADAILSGESSGVEIFRDTVVDPTAGEFRVDVDEDATANEWGEYWQLVVVDPPGGSRQTWRGGVTLESRG